MKNILVHLTLLFALVLSGPTNCNGGAQGNTLEFDHTLFLDDVETEDTEEECVDAYICKLSCNCPSGVSSLYFKMTTNDQVNLYLKICTTSFADSYLNGLDSNGDNFRIDLIRKFFADNTFANTLAAQGISPPISVILKNAVVNYLTTNENKILSVGQNCCKPYYK